MKSTFTILSILLLSLGSIAQSNQPEGNHSWSIGLQLAATGNPSTYSGGMVDANALFSTAPYGAGRLGIYGRYCINERLSLQSGFDFTQIGFNFALAQDYSLLKPESHYAALHTGTGLTRIPVILIYNSKLNCRNYRWIVGLGLAADFIDSKWQTETSADVQNENLNNTSTTTMSAHSHTVNPSTISATWLIGSEKVFKRGSMLDLTLQWNHGFSTVAQSTVEYTADNKYYTHTFINRGSYFALALTYYFKPVGSKGVGLAVSKLSTPQAK